MILPPLAASAKSGERHHGRRAIIVRWCFAGLDLLALERAYGLAILSPCPSHLWMHASSLRQPRTLLHGAEIWLVEYVGAERQLERSRQDGWTHGIFSFGCLPLRGKYGSRCQS